MSSGNFILEDVGKIRLTRRKGSTRMTIRVKPDGLVSVNYPWFASKDEVEKFIFNNLEWIKKQKNKVKAAVPLFKLNQEITLKKHRIRILPYPKEVLRAGVKDEEVTITVPEKMNIDDEKVQRFIYKIITEACRKEAKHILPLRVHELAGRYRLQYNKVFVKNLKSKWGSCSTLGNINLNVHLMRLPDHLIDYIILHELSHTVEMNHGRAFWRKLDEITEGKARLLDRAMKQESRSVLLPY